MHLRKLPSVIPCNAYKMMNLFTNCGLTDTKKLFSCFVLQKINEQYEDCLDDQKDDLI